MNQKIIESDFEKAKRWAGGAYLDHDLLLLDRLAEAPFPREPRRMNFILVGLCTQGSVHYCVDTQEQVLTPGSLIIVSERHVIDNYKASPDLEGLCMMMSVPFFNEVITGVSEVSALMLFTRNHPVMKLTERDQQVFRDYFYVIQKRISDVSNHFRRDLVRTLILAMFYDLSNIIYQHQQSSVKHHSRGDILFTQFLKSVEENCKHERRVSWYAEQLFVTPKYLSETVKYVSKLTPNEWIENYVTLEARVLLKNSTKSIKEIVKELNFPNQSFFGKYFKDRVGISPSAYRKS